VLENKIIFESHCLVVDWVASCIVIVKRPPNGILENLGRLIGQTVLLVDGKADDGHVVIGEAENTRFKADTVLVGPKAGASPP